jgi:hypothetical protein
MPETHPFFMVQGGRRMRVRYVTMKPITLNFLQIAGRISWLLKPARNISQTKALLQLPQSMFHPPGSLWCFVIRSKGHFHITFI